MKAMLATMAGEDWNERFDAYLQLQSSAVIGSGHLPEIGGHCDGVERLVSCK